MKPILEVENLSKEFLIGGEQEPYKSLRDIISNPLKKLRLPPKQKFRALNDVNFKVMPGDSIGIIGRNGAGKSTLLKILSGITPPSGGKIICRGRIASLLEVGTGFHPELTGRENVYMNGSILGMKKHEINKHFDAIVDFSGVAKFLDTPLKRYSSGMQLRLAFAVAAHLEPEILVIDEVLAVGDAEFQKKCLGKMDEVSKSGRTVLFVSHNMTAVQALCPKSLMLTNGTTEGIKSTGEIINQYYSLSKTIVTRSETSIANKKAYIISTKIINEQDEEVTKINTYENFYVEIRWFNRDCEKVNVTIELFNYSGRAIMFAADVTDDWYGTKKIKKCEYISRAKIPGNWLRGDEYFIRPGLISSNPDQLIDVIVDGNHLSIIDPADENCLARGDLKEKYEHFTHFTSLEWENIPFKS
jgi:lipopolysaccharide transport system ATP-binding protein